jgi:ABC-type branched-subunit amino acid transport system ATPase component
MVRVLKLKEVVKTFGEYRVVDGITASFSSKQITGIIGPNGAGKTTIFNLITGEIHPNEGKIKYKNQDITSLLPHQVAHLGIGKMFQDIRVFKKLSTLDNIIIALQKPRDESIYNVFFKQKLATETKEKYREKAQELLEFIGLAGTKDKYAEDLSYGQQKLLALGRLLAGDFELLLLDEPTAGINPTMIDKILGLLEKMVNEMKKTIIVVEHDMAVIENICSWIIFLNEGKIAFSGRKDHVLGAGKVREIYLGLESEK